MRMFSLFPYSFRINLNNCQILDFFFITLISNSSLGLRKQFCLLMIQVSSSVQFSIVRKFVFCHHYFNSWIFLFRKCYFIFMLIPIFSIGFFNFSYFVFTFVSSQDTFFFKVLHFSNSYLEFTGIYHFLNCFSSSLYFLCSLWLYDNVGSSPFLCVFIICPSLLVFQLNPDLFR